MRMIDNTPAPRVKDRGIDWEISVDETPFDLCPIQGEIPPPFESIAGRTRVQDNRPSPYASATSHKPTSARRSAMSCNPVRLLTARRQSGSTTSLLPSA
ncbi:hypothetical protein ACVWWN_006246 [Mycobacterium sp. URHB0021]